MQMTYESMMIFAETWIANWNRRDVEAVPAHFAEEARVRTEETRFCGASGSRSRNQGQLGTACPAADFAARRRRRAIHISACNW
jgi:hypothetical protein